MNEQPLLSVSEARAQVLARFRPLPAEPVGLADALGRVLAEPAIAREDLPPFANSSMDGYAVRAADVAGASAQAPIVLPVSGDIAAGTAASPLAPHTAMRIMTGAMLPPGADAVVPVEATDARWREGETLAAHVAVFAAAQPGAAVRAAGEDMRAGDTLVPAGTVLGAAEIAVLAAIGVGTPRVIGRPRVAIVSSGDELVEPGDDALAPGQIRNSNAYALAALVSACGGVSRIIPTARDTRASVDAALDDALSGNPHLIVSSAGVSVGAFDYMRAALEARGQLGFWRVNVRPGKPLAFGAVGGVPVVGLPGNPVSAQVTFHLFVQPALLLMAGKPDETPTIEAALAHAVRSDGRESYIRVTLHRESTGWAAAETGTQSSGALTSMLRADGLLVLPAGVKAAAPGDRFRVRVLRPSLLLRSLHC